MGRRGGGVGRMLQEIEAPIFLRLSCSWFQVTNRQMDLCTGLKLRTGI